METARNWRGQTKKWVCRECGFEKCPNPQLPLVFAYPTFCATEILPGSTFHWYEKKGNEDARESRSAASSKEVR